MPFAAPLAASRQAAPSDAQQFRYRGPSVLDISKLQHTAGASLDNSVVKSAAALLAPLPPLLAAVDVPGLPEGRPSLVTGDCLYVRLDSQPAEEYCGQLVAADGNRCLVAMPPAWWVQALGDGGWQDSPPPLVHVRFGFDRTALQVRDGRSLLTT